ncbi:MAG TPA: hypothetical protein VGI83_06190 [Gemmatimonadales bacterium]|jgi:hypothetical protein
MRGFRLAAPLAVMAALACGGPPKPDHPAPEAPHAQPLPTAGISGQDVSVYPLTLLVAAEELHWDTMGLTPRRAALDRADSLLGALLQERSPEVNWVLPPKLRRDAAQAPGMLTNPDQMATPLLRGSLVETIPDPLRSQMRQLNGVANARYALIPAGLVFVKVPGGQGRAELTLVMADVRTGLIGYRTVATAVGDNPWTALRLAIKSLVPGLP